MVIFRVELPVRNLGGGDSLDRSRYPRFTPVGNLLGHKVEK